MMCPCGSAHHYDECCGQYHEGALPKSAETLMRSRYVAFCLGKVDYIIKTTVPAQQALLDKSALKAWADSTNWVGLVINGHTNVGKSHARVHFCAFYDDEHGRHCHDELSAFVKVGERWYFLDPTVPLSLTNKQPCLCGSGKKFKACCAKFLSSRL